MSVTIQPRNDGLAPLSPAKPSPTTACQKGGVNFVNTIIIRVRRFFLLSAVVLLGLMAASSASAQGKRTANGSAGRKVALDRIVNTPCAEKRIRLNGQFQAQYTVTGDSSGETFINADFDATRVTALGLDSGSKYQASGTSRFDSRGPSPIEFSYVFNFLISKGGSLGSMMGHVKFRVGVNAKGEARTEIVDVNIDCNQ